MSDETTTDRLAEIEEQAADYTPPEGWRVLQPGEALQPGDAWAHPQADLFEADLNLTGVAGKHGYYLRRIEQREKTITTDDATGLVGQQLIRGLVLQVAEAIEATEQPEAEPDQTITPDDVAAEALAGVHDSAVVANPFQAIRELKRKLETTEAALLEQQQQNQRLVTHSKQQHMEIAELQAQVRFLKGREVTLGTRLQEEKAVTTKRLQQIEELRSEVSYVQGLLGESSRRVAELETLVKDLRAVNATTDPQSEPQPVHLQAMIDAQAETIARLHSEIHGLSMQNAELLAQREAVKAELVRQCENSRLLQIELDAREQVPQAVSDRFEEGWDAGTARAVETIAEWLEPIRTLIDAADNVEQTERASNLAADIMQNLPHIMRTLTGLTDED